MGLRSLPSFPQVSIPTCAGLPEPVLASPSEYMSWLPPCHHEALLQAPASPQQHVAANAKDVVTDAESEKEKAVGSREAHKKEAERMTRTAAVEGMRTEF
jgi:hypothetical protein